MYPVLLIFLTFQEGWHPMNYALQPPQKLPVDAFFPAFTRLEMLFLFWSKQKQKVFT